MVHGEVDAELQVQLPQFRGKAVHQPILPGDGVAPIDQDGERTRREAGLVKDGIKGMPWGQRPDLDSAPQGSPATNDAPSASISATECWRAACSMWQYGHHMPR